GPHVRGARRSAPNARAPLAIASARRPAMTMLFVSDFVMVRLLVVASAFAAVVTIPAVIALAAVAGVRAIVTGSGSNSGEPRARAERPAPPRRRPKGTTETLGQATERRSRRLRALSVRRK